MAYYSEKQKKYWAKWPIKRANKWWWIVKTGVLGWGIPVFLVTYLIKSNVNNNHFLLKEFLIGLIVWTLGGLIWGFWMFSMTEKKYKVFLENNEDDD